MDLEHLAPRRLKDAGFDSLAAAAMVDENALIVRQLPYRRLPLENARFRGPRIGNTGDLDLADHP